MKKKNKKTKKSALWLGFLEAGERSSPVVRDSSLYTGDPRTIYLFNLSRKRILEYRRDIVESKLRELNDGESSFTKELEDAFRLASAAFTPKGKPPAPPPRKKKVEPVDEIPDFEDDKPWPAMATDDSKLQPAEQPE